VIDFNEDYKIKMNFDIYSHLKAPLDSHIRAITVHEEKNLIAVGLMSGDIYEFDYGVNKVFDKSVKCRDVLTCHFNNNYTWEAEVRGLAVRLDERFLTCADDGTVREWNPVTKKCTKVVNLNIDENGMMLGPDPYTKNIRDCSKLRVIDINPKKSTMAAVGCYDGSIRILSLKTYKQKAMIRHHKQCINEIKYSPNGSYFAVGCEDSWISLYAADDLKLVAKVKKHTEAITHLDWSMDSKFLRSNCKGGELHFFDTPSLTYLPEGAKITRDHHWETNHSVFSWRSQGIYGIPMENPIVNSVDRFINSRDFNLSLMAASNEAGKVLLYRYPCIRKNAGFVEGFGHASPVANVRFSKKGMYLYSTGGSDLCVIQWKVTQK
jgi:WD40 repeat protein